MSDAEREREPAPLQTIPAILDRIDAAWRELMQALDGIPAGRLAEPGPSGDWSITDLYGHLAFWDEHAVREIGRAGAGLPRQDNEWQAMNEADHAARQGQSVDAQRAAMHRAHERLLERLRGEADADATRIDVATRPDTYLHYEEHLPDVREWRQRAGI
jgi:hypothetical protein